MKYRMKRVVISIAQDTDGKGLGRTGFISFTRTFTLQVCLAVVRDIRGETCIGYERVRFTM